MPAYSADIYVLYRVSVSPTANAGDTFINGASISNEIQEDPIYPNTTDKDISVPYPDPYVQITQPVAVNQGDNFSLNVQYGNNNRTCALSGYTTLALPNYLSGANALVQLLNVSP